MIMIVPLMISVLMACVPELISVVNVLWIWTVRCLTTTTCVTVRLSVTPILFWFFVCWIFSWWSLVYCYSMLILCACRWFAISTLVPVLLYRWVPELVVMMVTFVLLVTRVKTAFVKVH